MCLGFRVKCQVPRVKCLGPRAKYLGPRAKCLGFRVKCQVPRAKCLGFRVKCQVPSGARVVPNTTHLQSEKEMHITIYEPRIFFF